MISCILTRVRPVCCTLIYWGSSASSASWLQHRSDSSRDLMSMFNWWLILTMWSSSMLSLCLCPHVLVVVVMVLVVLVCVHHPPPSCMPLFPLITCWCLCVCVCVCVGVFVCVCGMLSPALSPGEKSKRNPLEFNQAGLKKASVSKAIKVTTR